MKRKYSICFLLLIAVSMSAQIAFWRSYPTQISHDNGVTWVDTMVADVVRLYDYDEVDSVSVYPFAYQSCPINILYLWKDGQLVNPTGRGIFALRDTLSEKLPIDFYSRNSRIDSIVWHPYALLDMQLPSIDTLPEKNLYGETITHTYEVSPRPYHATFSYSYSNSNPEVADVEVVRNDYNNLGIGSYLMEMSITPKQQGKTTIKLTFDGKIQKTFDLVVEARPMMQDEMDLSLDSLFDKIYSRLWQTGDMLPVGMADIPNVDEGYTSYHRGMFYLQELCSDQLYWIWSDPGIWDLTRNAYTESNVVIEGFFPRLYYNIWMCNSYLKRAEGQNLLVTKSAEVRFLRAYFYYQLLDMFGNVPIVTDNTQFTTTAQSNRSQLYRFVEAELLTVEKELPSVGYKTDYYRVDKAAAWLLLSRLYLNAEVYASVDEYSKAAVYAYKVIQSSYNLATHYKWLFMGDNDQRSQVNDAWKEIILPIRQDGEATANYGGSTHLVASMSDSYYYMPYTGLENTWKCIRSRAQLPSLFFDDPASAERGTAEVLAVAAKDDRALLCNQYNDQNWSYNSSYNPEGDFYAGWAIQKWTNLMADNTYVKSSEIWPETDIPLMRKAEAYLNYAEAVLRGGAENNMTAIEAVNVLRQRANAAPISSLTLDYLLDERGREFYAEGHRRSDLIRFGKFGGNTGYQWELKSGHHSGSNFPAYMNLYPIPAKFMGGMYQGVQNEGY